MLWRCTNSGMFPVKRWRILRRTSWKPCQRHTDERIEILGSVRGRKRKVTAECRNGDGGVSRGRQRRSQRVNLSRDAPRPHRLSRQLRALALALPPLVVNRTPTMPTRLRRTDGSWTIWFNRPTRRRVCPWSLISENRRIFRRPFSLSVGPRYVRRVRSLRHPSVHWPPSVGSLPICPTGRTCHLTVGELPKVVCIPTRRRGGSMSEAVRRDDSPLVPTRLSAAMFTCGPNRPSSLPRWIHRLWRKWGPGGCRPKSTCDQRPYFWLCGRRPVFRSWRRCWPTWFLVAMKLLIAVRPYVWPSVQCTCTMACWRCGCKICSRLLTVTTTPVEQGCAAEPTCYRSWRAGWPE